MFYTNNSPIASSTALPSVDSRSHFRSSRRAMVTVTSPRSWRNWAICLATPCAAASPAWETRTCIELPASNSGMGDSLDDLSDDGRREVLELLLDGVTIDRGNNVEITLAVLTEDVVSIEPSAPAVCGQLIG